MSSDLEDLDRFRPTSIEPLSFRERGTMVPFTTPVLVNARIREASSGHGLEMVVANPSGGRGALILPWEAMTTICSPTLFDRHLWESLAKAPDISPIGVRLESHRLAIQGLAGKHAASAARDAERREQASQRLVRSMILENLINSTQASSPALGRLAELDPEAFHKLARKAVMKSAEAAGLPLVEFADDLESLIEILTGSVPQIEGQDARLRQMLGSLLRITDEIGNWSLTQHQETAPQLAARFIAQTAYQAIECAEFVLSASDALIANIGLLLPNWKADRDVVFDRAMRPEWVLDGWGAPIALWDTAAPTQRAAAVMEMALIAPIVPREAKEWLGKKSETFDAQRRVAHSVREKSDWRSGNALELAARSENLVSFSVTYENRLKPQGRIQTKTRLSRPPPGERTTVEQPSAKAQAGSAPLNAMHSPAAVNSESSRRDRAKTNRALAQQLEVASDEALTKIVAVVDGLGDPEMRFRILGPSLHRLKRLRPPRRLSLKRLLFLPLSGALVDTPHWQNAEGRIPRSAIKPLMDALEPALSPKLAVFDQRLRRKTFDDTEVVGQVGNQLWALAAKAGPGLRATSFWKSSGLGPEEVEAIASLAKSLWQHGEGIWKGMQEAAGEARPDVLLAALMGPAEEGAAIFSAALAALLQRAPRPSVFAPLLQNMPPQFLDMFENLLMQCVGNTLLELPEVEFTAGAHLASDIGTLINALEEWHMTTKRLDAKELFSHRRNLDHYCLSTYREVVFVHVIQALMELHADQSETLAEIEAMARVARSLEETGKRFGSPQGYDAVQDEFHTQMKKAQQEPALLAAFAGEIARIREILISREAAERFILRSRHHGPGTR